MQGVLTPLSQVHTHTLSYTRSSKMIIRLFCHSINNGLGQWMEALLIYGGNWKWVSGSQIEALRTERGTTHDQERHLNKKSHILTDLHKRITDVVVHCFCRSLIVVDTIECETLATVIGRVFQPNRQILDMDDFLDKEKQIVGDG